MATLVTGAGGFLGKLLTERLLEEGETVHAMVHHLEKKALTEQPNLHILPGEIEDPESIRENMKGCDRVFHLAALATPWVQDHSLFYRVNVKGTENVLRIAEELDVGKVVHTSSAATLGPQKGDQLVTEEQSLPVEDALTYYETTKIQAEEKVRELVSERGVNAVIVNPTRLYGPGNMSVSNAVTKLAKDYYTGSWRIIPGSGKSMGNYVFSRDAIHGMLLAMEKGRAGERYLLGGENVDFRGLFKKMAQVSGCHRKMIRIPVPFLIFASWCMQGWAAISGKAPLITSGWVRKYLLNDWGADITKAKEELGYEPHGMDVGLRDSYEWLFEEGYLTRPQKEEREEALERS
jgi:farnesol dehydrogenase